MIHYEYKTLRVKAGGGGVFTDMSKLLNTLDENGWEAVSVQDAPDDSRSIVKHIVVIRRPLTGPRGRKDVYTEGELRGILL